MIRFGAIGLCAVLAGCAGTASAQQQPAEAAAPGADVAPGANREGVVHVNAIKDPEMHSYRAMVAGLDTFDAEHALAPAAPQLRFSVRARNSGPIAGVVPTAKLSADDFNLALPLDADARFVVPRNQQAWDTKAELVLSRKRRDVRIWPYVRTPGLADNQMRLGDLRLECKVLITIAKEEAPLWAVALGNTVLMTGDWCGFFKSRDFTWSQTTSAPLRGAVLYDGNRSAALKVKGRQFDVALFDPSWSNDALIELDFAPPAAVAITEGGKTGGTP